MPPGEGTIHVVQQGETILGIAHDYGFRTWQTIWEHAGNAELRQKRKDPNILYPGDRVVIPAKEVKQEPAQAATRNHYWVKTMSARIRFVVRRESGEKVANALYRLKVGDRTFEGRTDPEGAIEHEIHPKVRQGEITVWFDESDPQLRFTWPIEVGSMDPVEELSGVQKRLNNLGFDAGPPTGEMNDETREAIREFQEFIGHAEPTGDLDDETRRALEHLHNAG